MCVHVCVCGGGVSTHHVCALACSHAIKFGSNTDTLMRDILFDNVTIVDSNGGMSIEQRSEYAGLKASGRRRSLAWLG